MRIVNVRNCAIAVLAGVVLCACCALRGNDGTVGLSSRSVHLRLGSDTAVVTVRHAGWAIDSIRIYEDAAGSRLLDKTFCFSEKEKKRMRRGRPVERRYGWLNVKTGKNAITLVAVDTRLIVNKRCAVLYLHRRECRDSIRVEHEGHRFMAESAASARMQVFQGKSGFRSMPVAYRKPLPVCIFFAYASRGFGPYLLSPGVPAETRRNNSHRPPIIGTAEIKNHHPL